MTLMNGLIYERQAYLWTDSAVFTRDGKLAGHMPKAFAGELWPWAAVVSGLYDTSDPYRVARTIGEALPLSIETLLIAGVAALRAEAARGLTCRLLIAAACPTYGARMYFIAADETPLAPPFEPLETVEFFSSGNGSSRHAELDAKGFTPARVLEFIDYQAETPIPTVEGWAGQTIGGDIVELCVGEAGVTSHVVRERGLE